MRTADICTSTTTRPTARPYYFEDKGSDAGAYVPLPFKPETNETDPRPEFIAQWVQAVNQVERRGIPGRGRRIHRSQKFIRHVAVEVFIGDYDGFIGNYGINNFYVYRFDNQKRFQMIPWDKSEAFKAGADSSVFHNLNDVPDGQRNRLMTRFLSYPELFALYLDTLNAVAASASDGNWLEQEIQREYRRCVMHPGPTRRSHSATTTSRMRFRGCSTSLAPAAHR